MKHVIAATLAAFTVAGAAAAEVPDQMLYITCHGERTGEIFVMTITDDGIGSVPSHPGVEIVHQADGVTLVDPYGAVYQITDGDSFMIRGGEAHPMNCEDETETIEAGAVLMAKRMNAEDLEQARHQIGDLRREITGKDEEILQLETQLETMRAERAEIEEIRRYSAFLAERLPSRSTLAKWLLQDPAD